MDPFALFQFSVSAAQLNSSNLGALYITTATTYTENTIAVLLTLISILAISIQVARGYFLRVLRKFTLRVAADIWWLIFVILRDASIFLMVFLGFMLFYPGTYQDFPIAVPVMPLSIDIFAIALVILLIKDTDEEPRWNNVITVLVGLGTMLYIFGTVFVTESAVQLAVLPPTVSASSSNLWGLFYNTMNSQLNPALSIYSFYLCFGILAICGVVAFIYGIRGSMPRNSIKTIPTPILKPTAEPAQAHPVQQAPATSQPPSSPQPVQPQAIQQQKATQPKVPISPGSETTASAPKPSSAKKPKQSKPLE